MGELLNAIIVNNLFAFLLIFTRVGVAIMIMPGIGDNFVTPNVRLLFALAFSFVMTPILSQYMPAPPASAISFVTLIVSELIIGLFIGTVMRVLMSALDTAGAVISLQSGFANAQVFNPVVGGQGSLVGALLSMIGIVLIFATDLHHYLLISMFDSYQMFPANGEIPDTGSMADILARITSLSFNTGVRFAMPFIVIGLIMYLGFGLLGRLMPQLQIFFLALPLQILISLITLSLTISAGMLFWLNMYEETMTTYLTR